MCITLISYVKRNWRSLVLRLRGWKFGDAESFLGLSPKEKQTLDEMLEKVTDENKHELIDFS